MVSTEKTTTVASLLSGVKVFISKTCREDISSQPLGKTHMRRMSLCRDWPANTLRNALGPGLALCSFYDPPSPDPSSLHLAPSSLSLFPPPSLPLLFLMSDADQQLFVDAIHQQLNNAISFNLYTGIAYGTPIPTPHSIHLILITF